MLSRHRLDCDASDSRHRNGRAAAHAGDHAHGGSGRQDVTRDLFAEPKLTYAQAARFYQHDMDCAKPADPRRFVRRMMASLAQRENLDGNV